MKRRVIQVVLLLIAGAVVNVAVAWACNVRWNFVRSAEIVSLSPAELESTWAALAKPAWVAEPRWGHSEELFGLWVLSVDAGDSELTAGARYLAMEVNTGWPMRALRRVGQLDKHHPPWSDQWTWRVFKIHKGRVYLRMPLQPIWPGFAINTIFYAILTIVHVSEARIRVTQEYKDFPGLYVALHGVPTTPEWFRITPGAVDQRLGQSIDGKTVRRIEEGAVGWPMFSLGYWRAVSGNWAGYETLAAHGAIVISHDNGVIKYDRLLPFSPVLPGFAMNTIFYAAMLWVVFFVPGMVRRRIRRRRGRCPACAFPIGTSPVCTECGKALT